MNEDLAISPPGGTGTHGSPLRRCLASRTERPKHEMVRFSVDPDGVLVPDVDGRLPGRGLWLLADRDMLQKACKKGLFAKAARASVKIPDDLGERIERLLTQRCLDRIGLARRAGQAVAGFEKVRAMLRGGKVGVLLQAHDGAEGGRSKVQALDPGAPLIDLFDAVELGAAVGREHAVHMAVARGRLAEELIRDANRLRGFRKSDPTHETSSAQRRRAH
ncbi:MAG: RNA-binding protein [Rhodospirillales bacterium]|nr:RNA-binding protein [Rhodospirillales bacterium]